MAISVKQMLEAANAAVRKITPAEAKEMIGKGALVLDVRDAPEIEKSGKIPGALNVSRGMGYTLVGQLPGDTLKPIANEIRKQTRPI